ncbi:uncharacterized protein PV07_04085 [Cladophialophora immunda]|uniref:Major facilitator superfamily (MFS) profile domain-containing protein n=1 Tax=Cladophialophora immunda TaxID=569365 RepID=A0A0D2DA54_9EURO|nr:uncharacterized protein PV07_04085 [Cladophialophora immunda]KIW32554.1 hypothetical protein PV07_04085 [Cladophialophora immunda]OQU98896.1 hypothetical protein CLAIMM_04608 [Cladophialophora immunda]
MSASNEVHRLSPWRWNNPLVQAAFTSSICACTAGLYVAINGLGAGGGKPSSQTVASTTNAVNDTLWVFASLVGGALLNRFGPAKVLCFGASGFPVYLSGFWIYDKTGKEWVPPLMGALAGGTGGGLWAVQNWVATAYPTEQNKGLFIWINWAIIKSGATIGSLIALAINIHRTETSVAWQLYLAYVIIMCLATVAALFMARPETLRRNDGTALAIFKRPTLREEFKALWDAIRTREIILMLLPLFVCESYLAPYTSINGYSFTLRTRTLNNVLYWLVQIPAGWVQYKIADSRRFGRRTRAFILTTFVLIFVLGGLIGAIILTAGPDYRDRSLAGPSIDWSESRYASRCVLYIVWGISYGMFFQLRLWFMGALSNDPIKLGRYSSLIPCLQAAGITVAFGIDSAKTTYWKQIVVWFTLFGAAFACLYYLAAFHITETNYFKEEAVIVPLDVAEKAGHDTSTPPSESIHEVTKA